MGKNIVVCSDGTGNTFDSRITNVTRLVQSLRLDDPNRQVVLYDQGVGTVARRTKAVADNSGDPAALHMLSAPAGSRRPSSWVNRGRGLLFGYGLKENVRTMYRELARRYQGPDDRVFLFGFSRGAFTVRALAGLLHRCQVPNSGRPELIDDRFERAWRLFEPMVADQQAVAALTSEHHPCPVHFLGLWDTVKSYGGLNPVILPHLRHNPDVAHVRHALALDERRAWFKATTWGQLDSDRETAMTRLNPAHAPAYQAQDIREVWFTGCHSDIGTGDLALRWMLGEGANVEFPLLLSESGLAVLGQPDSPPEIHQSWTRAWRATEQLPRQEINNSGVYPVKERHRGSDGQRHPEDSRRTATVTVHASVREHSIPARVDTCGTQPPPAAQ